MIMDFFLLPAIPGKCNGVVGRLQNLDQSEANFDFLNSLFTGPSPMFGKERQNTVRTVMQYSRHVPGLAMALAK